MNSEDKLRIAARIASLGLPQKINLEAEYANEFRSLGVNEKWSLILTHCAFYGSERSFAGIDEMVTFIRTRLLHGLDERALAKNLLMEADGFQYEYDYIEHERAEYSRQIAAQDIKDEKHMQIFFEVFGE